MKDPKNFVLRKKQGVPKGVDPAKHERCVQDVKEQGHGKESAIKICNASMNKAATCKCEKCMQKAKEVRMPMKEFVKEHKKLVGVLRSPSHADDKKEADEQEKELKEYTKKSDYPGHIQCGTGLAGKICRHNDAKLNKFVSNRKKMRKSMDFQQTKTAIDSADQKLAEETTSPELLNYIRTAAGSEMTKIPFAKGMLTLSQKEPGLYNGFFQDRDGQVVEKFDSQTLEIVAKNMELKNLYDRPIQAVSPAQQSSPTPHHDADPQDEWEDRMIAREEAQKVVAEALASIKVPTPKVVRVKAGDFEVEIRKSVRDFVNDFRTSQRGDADLIKKSVQAWRKRINGVRQFNSDISAAKGLLENWDEHKEDFSQILDALQRLGNEK